MTCVPRYFTIKLQNTNEREKKIKEKNNLSQKKKKKCQHAFKRIGVRLFADFSVLSMKARSQWNDTF